MQVQMLPRYVGKGIWETVIDSVAGWQGSHEEGKGKGGYSGKKESQSNLKPKRVSHVPNDFCVWK